MKAEEVMASYNIRSIIYDIWKQKGQLTINYGTDGDGPFHASDTESTQISTVGQDTV
jgi:hypothetical protein